MCQSAVSDPNKDGNSPNSVCGLADPTASQQPATKGSQRLEIHVYVSQTAKSINWNWLWLLIRIPAQGVPLLPLLSSRGPQQKTSSLTYTKPENDTKIDVSAHVRISTTPTSWPLELTREMMVQFCRRESHHLLTGSRSPRQGRTDEHPSQENCILNLASPAMQEGRRKDRAKEKNSRSIQSISKVFV